MGKTPAGRAALNKAFSLCPGSELRNSSDVVRLSMQMLNAWDTLAMGNFPYASNYLVFQATQDPSVKLPPYPVRAACELMTRNGQELEGTDLLLALRDAAGVLYNASEQLHCFDLPSDPNFDGIWDYQYCTEMLPQAKFLGAQIPTLCPSSPFAHRTQTLTQPWAPPTGNVFQSVGHQGHVLAPTHEPLCD